MEQHGNLIDWMARDSIPVSPRQPSQFLAAGPQGTEPFVLRDPEIQQATKVWDPDYVRSQLSDVRASVYVSANGTFPGGQGPYDSRQYLLVDMSISEFIDRARGAITKPLIEAGEKYYLYQAPAQQFANLVEKIDLSRYLLQDVLSKNFWLSGPGNITPIHYDLFDNFLMQLMGRKTVLLWAPRHYSALEFNPIGSVHDRQSRIDPMHPDGGPWPRARRLQVYMHELLPGDVLYIPFAWSHFVRTEEFSASLNFWWIPEDIARLMSDLRSTSSARRQFELIQERLAAARPDLMSMIAAMAADGGLQNLLNRPEIGSRM